MPRAVHVVVASSASLVPNLIPDVMDPSFWATVGFEIAVFLLLLAVLRVLVFKPLLAVLEARDRAIEGARAEAEARMREADARTAEYEERLRLVRTRAAAERDALRAEGRKAEAELLEKVKTETAKAVEEGKAAVRREADVLRRELEAGTSALAGRIATRVLGRDPGSAS